MPTILACPTCQRKIEWSDAFPYRPFCSERCRLIDLGAWLSEGRSIPGDAPQVSEDSGSEADPPSQRDPWSSDR